jgi:hypothetical protein
MGLPDWLKRPRDRTPERRRVIATCDSHEFFCRWPDGTIVSVAWVEVRSVEIRTTDAGPFVEDVFLVLHTGDGGCIIPQEAEGFTGLVEHLQRWPGFDNKALISAMTCTDNATFLCWQR